MRINLYVNTLEPGNHIMRKTLDHESRGSVELPDDECKEIRPDWGVYHQIVTFPAIERALNKRQVFTSLPRNQQWAFSVATPC